MKEFKAIVELSEMNFKFSGNINFAYMQKIV